MFWFVTICFVPEKSRGAYGYRDVIVNATSRKNAERIVLAEFKFQAEIYRICPLKEQLRQNECCYVNAISSDCAFTPI